MFRLLMMVCVLILATVFKTASGAPVAYSYVGNEFVGSSLGMPCGLGSPGCFTNIVASFTLPDPLMPNLNSAAVIPVSWQFADGRTTVNDGTVGLPGVADQTAWAVFRSEFSTDDDGKISGWVFVVEIDDFHNKVLGQATAMRTESSADITYYCTALGRESACLLEAPAYISNNAGTWTMVSAVPAPPAVWLFGSALGLMGVLRRKISS